MKSETGFPRGDVEQVADRIEKALGPYVGRTQRVGSVLRRKATVRDLDLMVEVKSPTSVSLRRIKDILRGIGRWEKGGDRAVTIMDPYGRRGLQVDVFLVYPPRNWHSMVAFREGPAGHTMALRAGLDAAGKKRPFGELAVRSVKELHEMAGLDYLDPSDREVWE